MLILMAAFHQVPGSRYFGRWSHTKNGGGTIDKIMTWKHNLSSGSTFKVSSDFHLITHNVDENSVDPDQLWLCQKPADQDLHCFQFRKSSDHSALIRSIMVYENQFSIKDCFDNNKTRKNQFLFQLL